MIEHAHIFLVKNARCVSLSAASSAVAFFVVISRNEKSLHHTFGRIILCQYHAFKLRNRIFKEIFIKLVSFLLLIRYHRNVSARSIVVVWNFYIFLYHY
jgi:hypothetical protein